MNRNGVTQDTLRLRWHSICLCQRLYVFRILTLSLFLILYAWYIIFSGIISAFSQKKGVKRDSGVKYARGQNRKAASFRYGQTTASHG
ncbi:hypothetical protein AIE43_07505 [Salmonella enterica subsp. enterica]|nr:hypothetical protein LFZ3_16305 [Salmonella enterica subsp. enterica serovar Bergen str. ST350]ECI3137965.1 hypothetical protein [Salmonella enterica subsp. enterica]